MFVDFIDLLHLKGSYYGRQNLSSLGGAVNPLLIGLLLTYTLPVTIFGVMMLATLLSLGLFYLGYRLAQRFGTRRALDARVITLSPLGHYRYFVSQNREYA